MDKTFINAQALLKDSFELGLKIYESGYHPTYILGVWRGGAPVAIAVQEILETLGCKADHGAIRASSYHGGAMDAGRVEVLGVESLAPILTAKDRLLIVDDIFDTGRSMEAILKELRTHCWESLPAEIRLATLYYKPARNQTQYVPDYYGAETDAWIVFPHELLGCDEDELAQRDILPARFFKYLKEQNK